MCMVAGSRIDLEDIRRIVWPRIAVLFSICPDSLGCVSCYIHIFAQCLVFLEANCGLGFGPIRM